ncbi:hypothetical protein Rhopal_006585-T1 [Rhodotorula paludigena]|uniref:Calcineurin-like phosphoesterase domain-containing protein n=1 Tax=Rhodotorula paludigena TaxID=86838 RepID=A0AAV5GTJ1_9BASI|nr:hypothetical protein Rhopal_006585-T1 [Rhodotorula paludigena]
MKGAQTLAGALCSLPAFAGLAAAAVQLPFALPTTAGGRGGDRHSSAPLQQPGSTTPSDWPYRPLPWGDVNVLATTDTHGWLLGHQRNEPSFSGDWGDFYSFAHRLKEEAERRGVDLLLVDSGDRVDGNGLVDAEPSPHPKGYTALSIFSEMPYDVVTTGNHELYKYPVASYVSQVMSDKFGDRWVASNVNLTVRDQSTGATESRQLGNRFRKFTTQQGRKVTAFGPLFDFKAHAPGIDVVAPSKMVREAWFREAIASAPDFFLFVGHMSLRIEPDSEWSAIVEAIREIRDCVQEDDYSVSLAAGRYMETIGFMSVSGLDDPSEPPQFRRRYLDQNRNSYAYHTTPDFDTDKGRAITQELAETAKRFNLTERFGVAPQDYFLHRFPPTSPNSILHLLTTEVLPLLIRRDDRSSAPFTVLNSGSVRFDVFKGDFTRNDQWIILPFTNNFLYLPSVPRRLAAKLLHHLNLVGEHGLASSANAETLTAAEQASLARFVAKHGSHILASRDSAALEHAHRRSLAASVSASAQGGKWRPRRPSEGYVTLDACGGSDRGEQLGDDTAHRPFRSARQPVFVATELPPGEDETVDVVFFDFIAIDVVRGLNALGGKEDGGRYALEEVQTYIDPEELTANTLMETYAKRAWN